MLKRTLAVGALFLSAQADAECDRLQARFEGEGTRVVLTTIAGEAGWRIANPEVIRGTLEATFEDAEPTRLFPKLAALLGYSLMIRGDQVWLRPLQPD